MNMSSKDFTAEEVKSIFNMSTKFDILVAVAVATLKREKLQQQQQEEASAASIIPPRQPSPQIIPQEKRSRQRKSSVASTALAPQKRRPNPVQIRNRGNGVQLQPSPPLPERFKNKIEEAAHGRNTTPPELVIQKKLFATDVSHGHNRLLIPMKQIKSRNFLTEEEKNNLANKLESGAKQSMEVKIIDPSLEVMGLKFSQWDFETTSNYVIIGKWSDVVRKNRLEKGMEVQLWSFRIDHCLYFALVTL